MLRCIRRLPSGIVPFFFLLSEDHTESLIFFSSPKTMLRVYILFISSPKTILRVYILFISSPKTIRSDCYMQLRWTTMQRLLDGKKPKIFLDVLRRALRCTRLVSRRDRREMDCSRQTICVLAIFICIESSDR